MKAFVASCKAEVRLFMRDFYGPFFIFVFPVVMLVLFGSIYGNEPSPYFGGRGSMDVSVPSYSAMIIGVTGLMSFPLTLSEYKDKGVYKRFDATPVGKRCVMLAQVAVNFVMTLLGIALLTAVGVVVYKIQVLGTLLPILGGLLLSVAAVFSLGFFITAVAPTAKIANVLAYLCYFVMIFVSGATMPAEMFPAGMRSFSRVLLLTHVVDLFKATTGGEGLAAYWPQLVVLAAATLVLGGAGALLYRRKRW